jgi:hypothetical protein
MYNGERSMLSGMGRIAPDLCLDHQAVKHCRSLVRRSMWLSIVPILLNMRPTPTEMIDSCPDERHKAILREFP